MAIGYPDYTNWAGRTISGERVVNYSFTLVIPPGATLGFALPTPAEGLNAIYQFVCVSCIDNTSQHVVFLDRASDGWIFFESYFNINGIFDFPGQGINRTDGARCFITNNAAGNVTFIGTIGYVERQVN